MIFMKIYVGKSNKYNIYLLLCVLRWTIDRKQQQPVEFQQTI